MLKQGTGTTTPAGRFAFHLLAAMDEMLADLISEGPSEGLESARARGRAGGRKPKLTTRQAEVARGMYDETGADGRPKYTVAKIADTFGASGKPCAGTSNHPVAAASPARARGRPHAPGRWPRCRTQSMPASVRLPPEHGPSPLPRGPSGLAGPTCGHEPATRHEAVQQRQDLAIVWLHLDGDHLTEARHCVACQPHEPVIDPSCSGCGDGPLITGQPPELGARLAPPALD